MTEATFHLEAPDGERWTARAGQQLAGRDVEYGKLGKVGEVARTVPVSLGRSLRVHVALSRHLLNPDRRKFSLGSDAGRPESEATE